MKPVVCVCLLVRDRQTDSQKQSDGWCGRPVTVNKTKRVMPAVGEREKDRDRNRD